MYLAKLLFKNEGKKYLQKSKVRVYHQQILTRKTSKECTSKKVENYPKGSLKFKKEGWKK